MTNQITTHLSGALASQADLVSPADDLSLSEGKGSVLERLKLDTDIHPMASLPPVESWETWLMGAGQ